MVANLKDREMNLTDAIKFLQLPFPLDGDEETEATIPAWMIEPMAEISNILEAYAATEDEQGPYFVMDIPVNENGDGPTSIIEAHEILYQVWDLRTFDTVSKPNENLGVNDAAMKAHKLNVDFFLNRG